MKKKQKRDRLKKMAKKIKIKDSKKLGVDDNPLAFGIFLDALIKCWKGEKIDVMLGFFSDKEKQLLKKVKTIVGNINQEAWKIEKFKEKREISKEKGSGTILFAETILKDRSKLFEMIETYIDKIPKYPYGFDKQKRIVAEEILEKYKEFQNDFFPLKFSSFGFSGPRIENVQIFKTIRLFEKEGFLRIKSYTPPLPLPKIKQEKLQNYGIKFDIRITNKGIKELSKYLSEKDKDEIIKNKKDNTTLYLSQFGNLYIEPRKKHCYPMGERSDRYKILCFLAKNHVYQPTTLISVEMGSKSEKSIRTEIGKMRNNIKKYLKIDGKDLIQGKKESGYRINPKYKIIFKNE